MIDRKYIAQYIVWYEQIYEYFEQNVAVKDTTCPNNESNTGKRERRLSNSELASIFRNGMTMLEAYERCCELLDEWEMWPESSPKRGAAVLLRKALEGKKP